MNCASEGTTGKSNVLGTSLVIGTVFPKFVRYLVGSNIFGSKISILIEEQGFQAIFDGKILMKTPCCMI